MKNLKRRVHEILIEQPEGDVAATVVSLGILTLIAVNVIVSVAETVPEAAAAYPRFFYYFELFSVLVFTVEYVGRLWCCTYDERYAGLLRGRFKMALEPMSLIDFIAIAPFYLQILLPGLDLRFVRALRLFRLFRVFKVGRYAESFVVLVSVIRKRREELAVATVIVLITVTLAASVMWLCEHEAQPENFRSVPRAMWWAIITITTIGYGDVTPVTTVGRIVGGVVAFLGICIFALPVAIIGGAFLEEIQQQKEQKLAKQRKLDQGECRPSSGALVCPHCGKPLHLAAAPEEGGGPTAEGGEGGEGGEESSSPGPRRSSSG